MARGTSRVDRPPRPGARRPQPALARRTRARLVQSALDLFADRGIARTSMAEIAERAGVGVETLHHHFPDKRALILHLVDAWSERIEADRGPDRQMKDCLCQDPRAALGQFLRGYYERLHDENYLYGELCVLTYRDPEIRERCERFRCAGAARLAALVEFGQAQGVFRMEPAPDTAASCMINAIELLTVHVLKLMRPREETERVLEELTDMLCRYLLEEL